MELNQILGMFRYMNFLKLHKVYRKSDWIVFEKVAFPIDDPQMERIIRVRTPKTLMCTQMYRVTEKKGQVITRNYLGIILLGNCFHEITRFYNMETVMKAIFSKTTGLP